MCAFDFSVPLNGFMVGHKQREEETYTDRASVVARGAFQNKPEAKEEVRYRSVFKWSGSRGAGVEKNAMVLKHNQLMSKQKRRLP